MDVSAMLVAMTILRTPALGGTPGHARRAEIIGFG